MVHETARHVCDRRTAVRLLGAAVASLATAGVPLTAWAAPRVEHPDPRPGVTAARVRPAAEVAERHRDAYDAAREIPEVLDGLFCHCDCARVRGMRSLLSCFESDMPGSCGICLGEARLARRLHRQGKSLPDIRAAVDRQYGRRSDSTSHDHR